MNYWFAIINAVNWEIIKRKLILGFRKESTGSQLQKGDLIVIYVKSNQLSGIYAVVDKNVKRKLTFKGGDFPYQFRLKEFFIPEYPIKLVDKWIKHNIINNLSFLKKSQTFKNQNRWGLLLFGKSLIKMTKKDFECLNYNLHK
jgi:predicted RNA-binding protein